MDKYELQNGAMVRVDGKPDVYREVTIVEALLAVADALDAINRTLDDGFTDIQEAIDR